MTIIAQVLFALALLLFFAGAVCYAFNRHFGIDLLKRAVILVAVVLIGPSLLGSVLNQLPPWILLILGVAASLAAYHYLSGSSGHESKPHHGASSAHAERRPLMPHDHEDEQ